MSAVAVNLPRFEKLGVKVFACSVDSKFVHKIWDEEELSKMTGGPLPYPILSDMGGKIGRIYGIYDENAGVDIRGRFLIDPDGIIQSMEVLTPPVGRKVSEAVRQVQAYQHVRETKGAEVCPAGWEPGKPVLKVGPDLVGKVWKVWKPEDE